MANGRSILRAKYIVYKTKLTIRSGIFFVGRTGLIGCNKDVKKCQPNCAVASRTNFNQSESIRIFLNLVLARGADIFSATVTKSSTLLVPRGFACRALKKSHVRNFVILCLEFPPCDLR